MTTTIQSRGLNDYNYITYILDRDNCKSYVFSWQKRRLPLIAILQYSSQIVETGAVCLEFFLNFLHSLFTPLFSLKCTSPLSQCWAERKWSTKMTANPNHHWEAENQTSVSRSVMRIRAHLCLMTIILTPRVNKWVISLAILNFNENIWPAAENLI